MSNHINSNIPDKTPITYTSDVLAEKVRDAASDGEALGFLLGQLVSFGYNRAVSEYAKRLQR